MPKRFLLFIILISSGKIFGQPGSLDLSFGNGGKVITLIRQQSFALSTAIQNDGRIIAAGASQTGATYGFALARYKIDGTLDSSFNSNGIVTTDFGFEAVVNAIAIQSDNKIIATGYYSYNNVLVRYNVDGSLDSTFNNNGMVTEVNADYYSIIIQGNGKILLGGIVNGTFGLGQYNINGTLDSSFGTNGHAIINMGFQDQAASLAVQNDGKILLAGSTYVGNYTDFSLARFQSNGNIDSSFATNGKVITTIVSDNDWGNSVAIQSDGKIVFGGYASNGFSYDMVLIRYDSTGVVDNSFGSNGKVITSLGSSIYYGSSVVIQSDGKILQAGCSTMCSFPHDFALLRFNSDGTPDNTFGISGITTTDFDSSDDVVKSMVIQSDGRIILAGGTSSGITGFALARYNGNALGINEISNSSPIVFPNPFSNEIIIRNTEAGEIIFYDLTGKEILREHIDEGETKINTEKFSPGFYLIHYNTVQNASNIKAVKF